MHDILRKDRIRSIEGGFSFIPHRFFTDGFLCVCSKNELVLYFFLVLVANKDGVSWYGTERIQHLTDLGIDELYSARRSLCRRDLIAYESGIYQVLALPDKEEAHA